MKLQLLLTSISLYITASFAIAAPPFPTTPIIPPPRDSFTTIQPTPTSGPEPIPSPCVCPGPILCCDQIADSLSEVGEKVLRDLYVGIKGAHIPIGVACWKYDPTQRVVCTNPVCCFDARTPEIGAVGCVRVPDPRPGPTIFPPPYSTAEPY